MELLGNLQSYVLSVPISTDAAFDNVSNGIADIAIRIAVSAILQAKQNDSKIPASSIFTGFD